MNGQWIGPYTGTNTGSLAVELDDVGGGFEGSALAVDSNPALPTVVGEFLVPKGQREFKLRIPLRSAENIVSSARGIDIVFVAASRTSRKRLLKLIPDSASHS